MTTDLDRRLADLRSTPQWSRESRDAVLAHVLAADPTPQTIDRRLASMRPHRGRRNLVAAASTGLAAAALVGAAAVLPAGTPGSAPPVQAAAVLHRLAGVAAADAVGQVGAGQYVHLVDVGHQAASPGQPSTETRYEYWIRPDGLTYQRRMSRSSNGPSENDVWLTGPGPQTVDGMTEPVYLDRLPTDPAILHDYLQAHTSGSNSPEERLFVAAADIVRRAVAGPKLRAAAIDVLAGLTHVRLTEQTHDSMGNAVRAFEFADPDARPDEARVIVFATSNAQITEERDYFHDKLFATTTVPVFEIVNTVPTDVQQSAVRQK